MAENETNPPAGGDELETKLGAFRAADSPAQADRVSRDRLMYRAGYAAGQRTTEGSNAQPAVESRAVEKSDSSASLEKVRQARADSEADQDRDDYTNKFWKVMGVVGTMAAVVVLTWNWWPQFGDHRGLELPVSHAVVTDSPFVHGEYGADVVPTALALKQVALALKDHHRREGKWIDLANFNDKGEPLLSWRVHLLPRLPGGEELYKQFHLDEPWNSEHNVTLIKLMPAIYGHPRLKEDKVGKTRIMAPKGDQSMWQSSDAANQVLSNEAAHQTVLLVIGKEPVFWTQPDDWSPEIPAQPSQDAVHALPPWTTKGLWIYEGRVLLGMADGLIHPVDIKALRPEETVPPAPQ
jgi:hypothetical protein